MIYTTLNKIRSHSPCHTGWRKLLSHLGKTEADDEPLSMITILNSNGLDDAIWCVRSLPEHDAIWRKFAVWCASRVAHLCQDERSLNALRVAWSHAECKADDAGLSDAWDAARDAGLSDAWVAAWAAARAAAWAEQSRILEQLFERPGDADRILMDDTLRGVLATGN